MRHIIFLTLIIGTYLFQSCAFAQGVTHSLPDSEREIADTVISIVTEPITDLWDDYQKDRKSLSKIRQYQKVKVIDEPHENYFKAVFKGQVGYISKNHLELFTPSTLSGKNENQELRSSPSSPRKYITGPRGGCYYINRSGNKQYVDREKCR